MLTLKYVETPPAQPSQKTPITWNWKPAGTVSMGGRPSTQRQTGVGTVQWDSD